MFSLVKHGTRVQRKRTPSLIPHFKEKQSSNIIIEDWLVERLTEKLREASITVQQRYNPHLLYRATIEENEVTIQEEVGIISGKHIVIMIYSYGGFIASGFQKIEVYTLDRFTKWIIQKGKKNLLLQCLESLE